MPHVPCGPYFTVYRPLIGGTIVGLILGDVQQGMAFGAADRVRAALNAVHLRFVSSGGTLPSDLVAAGYIGTALALVSGLDVDAALAAFGVPLGVLGGVLWGKLVCTRMTLGSVFVHWADACAERGDTRGVAAVNLWTGQGLLFLLYALPTFVIVYYGSLGLDRVWALVPGPHGRGVDPIRGADPMHGALIVALSVVGGMLPVVGIGLLLRSIGKGRLIPYFIVGFVLSIYLELPILVIALLGVAAAWLAVTGTKSHVPGGAPFRSPTQGTCSSTTEAAECEPAGRRPGRGIPQRVLWGAWWRWLMFLHASYNYERLQGLGFAHAMKPVIDYLYTTLAERAAALRRHLVLFNSEPQFGALVPAAIIAMEEERASGADISDEAINGVKSGLMGPLAGVGDSLIQGLITPLLLSLGISSPLRRAAQQGNLAGPVLYSVLISAAIVGSSGFFWALGYRCGKAAVSRVLASGWVQALTDAASVVGMTVLGGLTATIVRFSTPASIVVGQAVVSLQGDVLDPILRGLLPMALTLSAWWSLTRRLSPMRSPLRGAAILFVAGIDLVYVGLAGRAAPSLFSAEWVAFLVGGVPATVGSALAHLWPPLLATGLAVVAGLVQLRKRTRSSFK